MPNSPLRRVRLPSGFPGQLYLSYMPGYHRSVEIHTAAWSRFPTGTHAYVLCLAGKAERRRKSPDYPKFLEVVNLRERWIEFPIRDRSVPNDLPAFLRLLDRLGEILVQPDHLLAIHCAAGVGRTGTVATALLVRMGQTYDEAIAAVREAGSGPETESQKRVVRTIRPLPAVPAPMPADSESEILRRLLDQFDAPEIREQLQGFPTYRHDALVPGDQTLPRLMRCIQTSDLDLRGRSLNEIVVQALKRIA